MSKKLLAIEGVSELVEKEKAKAVTAANKDVKSVIKNSIAAIKSSEEMDKAEKKIRVDTLQTLQSRV